MTAMTHKTEIPMRGQYTIKMTMTTGDASLELQVGSEGFAAIPDSTYTADAIFNVDVGAGDVRCVITGDAVVYATPIYNSPL